MGSTGILAFRDSAEEYVKVMMQSEMMKGAIYEVALERDQLCRTKREEKEGVRGGLLLLIRALRLYSGLVGRATIPAS